MSERPKVGISRCLLGEKVRYDGGQKRDRYLTDILGQYVEWVGVCPEVECGLPVPREAMRLVGNPEHPRLITQRSSVDLTDKMLRWSKRRLDQLERNGLCGFIFKTRSPSSAMRDAKIYPESGGPPKKGPGLFGRAFIHRFPLIPVEDEGRLNDPGLRENFIERLFVCHRYLRMEKTGISRSAFIQFHTEHKLLVMSHGQQPLRRLGRLTAEVDIRSTPGQYVALLMETLKKKATVKKHVNVLQHIMGYFKKQLSTGEKQEMLRIIDEYHRGLIPLIVPITLLNHYVHKYDEDYLKRQVYLHPHPAELMLRNHV